MSKTFLIDQVQKAVDLNAFDQKVKQIAADVGAKVEDLMLVMYFESRLNPAARNPYGSATGLLQFTESTANAMGTTTSELAKMLAEEQLKYVLKYLAPFKGRISSLGDLYLSVFYPSTMGKPDNYVLPLSAQWVNANKIFDTNKDGKITVGEIRAVLDAYKQAIAKKFNYALVAAGGAVALLVVIGLIYLAQ
jgi:hypothetical protein